MSTILASVFVAYATHLAAGAKGYGMRSYNNLPQRGPDYWDCIGFVRACILANVPALWPSNRGGEDSWTVPNFLYWWQALHLGVIDPPTATPHTGDILIFGASAHIGVADGAGNVIASTPPRPCSTPIASVGLPLTYILRTGLVQADATPPAPSPTPPPNQPPARTYTVQPFDNLSLIGRKLGVPWRSIYAANLALIGRTPNLIRVGWVLTIPGR